MWGWATSCLLGDKGYGRGWRAGCGRGCQGLELKGWVVCVTRARAGCECFISGSVYDLGVYVIYLDLLELGFILQLIR